jgi:ribosomal protein S6--L-glutamate ligase
MNTRRFVTLVSGFGWHVQDLLRAAQDLDVRLDAVMFPELTGKVGGNAPGTYTEAIKLDDAAGVLVRMMPPGSLEQVVFRMDALHRLAAAGVPVLNAPRAVETAVDKYLTLSRLNSAGLPVPPTWVGETADAAIAAFDELGRDVVVKPLFGSEGRGLVRVTDRETFRRVASALERIGSVIYVQSYINHPGHDVRLFVLGDRILGAIRRHAAGTDWRTNVAVGGRPEAFLPDNAMIRLALRASAAVGTHMAGVDLLPDPSGRLVVLEVNAVPGWRALAGATGADVAREILVELRAMTT